MAERGVGPRHRQHLVGRAGPGVSDQVLSLVRWQHGQVAGLVDPAGQVPGDRYGPASCGCVPRSL
jgi:hypothetical protein